MKKWLAAFFALCLSAGLSPAVAGPCDGDFPPGTICGNAGATTDAPGPVPFSTLSAAVTMDVFLVIGDSNSVGQGVAASSPTVEAGTVKQYCAAGTISDANDPTCSAVEAARNANTGSIWPTFGVTYYRATGRKVGFILTGKSGSTQTSAGDLGSGNWDSTGALFTDANTALTAGLAAYRAAGYGANLSGIIMHLGANDALQIDTAVITANQYETSLLAMLVRWRSTLGNASLPIYVIQTGSNITGGVSDSGYSQVRVKQKSVSAADPYTPIVFLNTLDFVIRGMMSSGAHPNQAGYNETGSVSATNILAANAKSAFQGGTSYSLYWPHGSVAIGNPLPDALLSVNPNRQANAESPTSLAVTHFSGLSPGGGASAFDAYGGLFSLNLRASGGTIEAPTATPNAQIIGSILWYGHDGTDFSAASDAALACATNQLFTGTNHGTFCSMQVTPDGTATKVTSQGWENDGGVTIPRSVTGGTKGLGTINATQIYRAGTVLATVATSASATDLSAGTLAAARLPAFGSADVSFASGGGAGTIAADAVTNAKLANMANGATKCRTTAGTGDPEDCTVAQHNQLTQAGMLKVCSTAMDISGSNTDHALTIPIPSANYRVILVLVYGANASLTTATAGVFTQTGGAGLAVAATQALAAVTTTTANTAGNAMSMAIAGVYWLTASTLQFRVTTGQAATISVCIYIDPLD